MLDENDVKRRKEIAGVRFCAIAPLVQGTYGEDSMAEYARRISKQPLTMPDGTSRYFSAKTILRWKSDYDREGFRGLIPKTRCDRGTVRAISGETQAAVCALHEQFPRLSASQMRDRLVADGDLSPSVSLATLQRFLRRVREEEKEKYVPAARERKAFEMEYPNIMWQADTAYFPPIMKDGRLTRTYMMVLIDDHSRMLVGAQIFWNDNALNFQTMLKSAVQTYGIPAKLLTDNGAPYANEQLRYICASIGTVLIAAKPRDPQTKGKCERVIRTCRDQFLAGLDASEITSLEEFNKLLRDWIRVYNNTLHSTTKQAPRARFREGIQEHPLRRPSSAEWLDECFCNRVIRKVRSDSTVQFNCISFDAPMQFIGQKVEIRFSPEDPEDAFIWFGEQKYTITPTDRIANGKAKRQTGGAAVNYALEANRNNAD